MLSWSSCTDARFIAIDDDIPLRLKRPGTGDEWPGGCFGKWVGADGVASTLRAVHGNAALRPGTPRQRLALAYGGTGTYAALRTALQLDLQPPRSNSSSGGSGSRVGVVIVLNFGANAATTGVDLNGTGVQAPQAGIVNLIDGTPGPPIGAAASPWQIRLPAQGWAAFNVTLAATAKMQL